VIFTIPITLKHSFFFVGKLLLHTRKETFEICILCTIIHNNQSSGLLVYLVQTSKPFQKKVDQIVAVN
jgi:hypothetical protein